MTIKTLKSVMSNNRTFSHEEASSRWDESEREAEFWRGVLKEAKTNPALQEELDRVKAFYILSASSV
jgi:hypothetical protein